MARLIPAGGGGLPVGVPLHLPIAELPRNCALLDGSPMPDWASSQVKAMYGATLPDYRGRTPVGTDEGAGRVAAAWAQTPGQGGGEDRHTLTNGEMPAHNHPPSVSSAGAHGHTARVNTASGTDAPGGNLLSANAGYRGVFHGSGLASLHGDSIAGAGNHGHNVNINNAGGGNAHNNMQPSIAGRWVMRLR